MYPKAVLLFIAILAGAAAPVYGSFSGALNVGQVDVSNWPDVRVFFRFKDSGTEFSRLNDLSRFGIKDNGKNVPVLRADNGPAPLALGILMDSSGSMAKRLDSVKQALFSFTAAMDPQTKWNLVDFDTGVRILLPFDEPKTTASVSAALKKMKPGGGTALYDALRWGLKSIKNQKGMKALVILTDGKDEGPGGGPGSKATFDEVLTTARESSIPVFGIRLGTGAYDLSKLCSGTGGTVFAQKNLSGLDSLYNSIHGQLLRFASVTFRFSGKTGDVFMHNFEFSISTDSGIVSTTGFYYPPLAADVPTGTLGVVMQDSKGEPVLFKCMVSDVNEKRIVGRRASGREANVDFILPAGKYMLILSTAGGLIRQPVVIETGKKTIVSRTMGKLRISARGGANRPVDAAYRVKRRGHGKNVVTGHFNGQVDLMLPDGDYSVDVFADVGSFHFSHAHTDGPVLHAKFAEIHSLSGFSKVIAPGSAGAVPAEKLKNKKRLIVRPGFFIIETLDPGNKEDVRRTVTAGEVLKVH